VETLLFSAVGTASHQLGLEACTVGGGSGNWWKNGNALALEEPSL